MYFHPYKANLKAALRLEGIYIAVKPQQQPTWMYFHPYKANLKAA
jgi:hypothetical protein